MVGPLARPASGQIAVYVTENGKRVYINANPPAPRKTASGKSAAASKAGSVRLAATPAPKLSSEELERIIKDTAERHHVDPALVRAVIQAESGGSPAAVSRKGAQGLMQLVPGTAQKMGVSNAFDPEQNVDGGVRYLRMLLERYHGDLDKALAAYNAGPSAVDRARGVPNIPETRAYVQKVTDSYFQPGSGRGPKVMETSRPIYRIVDERGRVIYVNE
jgi:soluble lytic murein transglycosylase-like protein